MSLLVVLRFMFFFSSRRRHTRFDCDWSSDVCSSDLLYAAFWQAQRKPWQLMSGGVGGGIFKSSDGGENWTELTHNPGLPAGLLGNIGVGGSPAEAARPCGLVQGAPGGRVPPADRGGSVRLRHRRGHQP